MGQNTAPQPVLAKKFAVVAYLPEWRYHQFSALFFCRQHISKSLAPTSILSPDIYPWPSFILHNHPDQPLLPSHHAIFKHDPIQAITSQIRRRELGGRLRTCHAPVAVLSGAKPRWINRCPRSTATARIDETRARSHKGHRMQADDLLWRQWPKRRSVSE